MKLEGRTKEITTKRKKDREVNWREREKEKEKDRDSIHAKYVEALFFLFAAIPLFAPPRGERWPTYPTIRVLWCKKDESKSRSDCWFNQPYEYRCGYFFVVARAVWWFLTDELTLPNYRDSDRCLLHNIQNLLILFHELWRYAKLLKL